MFIEALKKTTYRTVIKLGLLAGLLTLFFWLWLYTHLGLRWTIHAINVVSPIHIDYQASEGYLAGPISFKGLRVQSIEFELNIQDIQFNGAVSSLIFGTLELDNVMVSTVDYKPLNVDENSPPPSLEEIKAQFTNGPIRLKVNSFTAQTLHFQTSTPITIDHFSFTKADSHQDLFVRTLVLEGSFGHLSMVGEDEKLNIHFDLNVPDLSVWSKQMSGDFHGRGQIIVADLNDPFKTTRLDASLNAKNMRLGQHHMQGFNLNIKGTLDKLITHVKGTIDKHQVQLSVTTTYDNHEWKLKLQPSQWYHPKYGKLPNMDGYITFNHQSFMEGQLHFNLFDGNQLDGHYKIDPQQNYALSGSLTGQFNRFDSISKLFPEVDQMKGSAVIELILSGTLEKPKLKGHAHLKNLYLPLADLGTQASIEYLNLTSSQDGILDIDGQGTLGGGAFQIKGQTNFKSNEPVVHIRLTGQQLVLSNTPEYYIVANPDLTLSLKNGTPELSGHLFIDQAKVQLEDSQSYIAPSGDVTIVQNKQNLTPVQQAKPSTLDKLTSNIKLQLGEDVHFKGYGLETKLEGSLNLIGSPDQPLKATGKVHLVDGVYHVRGKKLTLTKGSLIFSQSPLANPAIDVRGQREIRNFAPPSKGSSDYFDKPQIHHGPLVVGVSLTGTLKSPVLKLFSNPHLSDGDILSYLLLDKPQSGASVLEGQLLFQAANELIFQFGSKTKDLRPSLVERFHLDKLELQSAPNRDSGSGLQDTVLVVGKQFSSRLYAEYSYGLIDSASSVHLRYLVGKHVTLETSASRNSVSADLLFIFETG